MENVVFLVNEEPYCLWDIDLKTKNTSFIEGVDVEYFDYLVMLYLESSDSKRASVAIKTLQHHAMETFFSLLGCFLQAPNCGYAWIAKCKNRELREMVKNINAGTLKLHPFFKVDKVSWNVIADLIFQELSIGSIESDKLKENFVRLWSNLSREFLDKNQIDEYNSIKHGFRVSAGGFMLSFGLEKEYGEAAPEEDMTTIGSSEHGLSFLKVESLGPTKGNRSLKVKQVALNWNLDKNAVIVQLVTLSIKNIVSRLKIVNGFDAQKCQFFCPEDESFFEKPWCSGVGVNNFEMSAVHDENNAETRTTRKELLKIINDLS
ncbi:hypothetical protein AVO42_04750 [Thiomicrospira sp. XS5]|uniref:hypothetical protein n=1 Tax=Thiomicrospira sp. XS5 TaxID=1775636 RepID=UPI000748EE4A|nr:hypothetical protein [Thiomicrospira sp. XS5]KUJ74703.1 hypothetical protein AVO42_04750 [Thiomicrospira sp. XS5]